MIKLEENILSFEQSDLDLLNPNQEKIVELSIMYVDDKEKFPIIGLSSLFGDDIKGYKVSKAKSISFRGQQNRFLSTFGSEFTLEVHSGNIYKMVSTKPPVIKSVAELIEEIDINEEVLDDTNYTIDILNLK